MGTPSTARNMTKINGFRNSVPFFKRRIRLGFDSVQVGQQKRRLVFKKEILEGSFFTRIDRIQISTESFSTIFAPFESPRSPLSNGAKIVKNGSVEIGI